MRVALLIAILAGSLAACDLLPSTAPSAAPSAAASAVPSRAVATAAPPGPSATPSLQQLGESFLVVASKYQHTMDIVNDRHLLKSRADYTAYCREGNAAVTAYIDGLGRIQFGADQQPAIGTLLDSAHSYQTWLSRCAHGGSLAAIKKIEGNLRRAAQATEDAAIEVRQALGLPIPNS